MAYVNFVKSKNLSDSISNSKSNTNKLYFPNNDESIILNGKKYGVPTIKGKINLQNINEIKTAQSLLTQTNEVAFYLIADNQGKLPSKQSCYVVYSENVRQLQLTSPNITTNAALAIATLKVTINAIGVNVGDLIAITRVKVKVSDLISAMDIDLSLSSEIEIYQYKIFSTNDAKPTGHKEASAGVMGLMSPWDKKQVDKISNIESTANNALPKNDLLPSRWESNMNNALQTGVYPWCNLGRPAGSTGHYTCIVNRTSTSDGAFNTIEQTAYGREAELGQVYKRIIFEKTDGTDTQFGEWVKVSTDIDYMFEARLEIRTEWNEGRLLFTTTIDNFTNKVIFGLIKVKDAGNNYIDIDEGIGIITNYNARYNIVYIGASTYYSGYLTDLYHGGNGITLYKQTASIANSSITTDKIANGAITADKIADGVLNEIGAPIVHAMIYPSTETVQIGDVSSPIGYSIIAINEDENEIYVAPSYILDGELVVCDIDYSYMIGLDTDDEGNHIGTIRGKVPTKSQVYATKEELESKGYVKYVAQTLTEEQQKQARLNIGLNEVSNINYDLNVKAINHRGYSYESPENTIPSYIMSKAKGFTYVEGDVAFTKDNVAVLLHDNTIDRTSNGSGKITDFNYQELLTYDFGSWFSSEYEGVKIPTFKEWILLCKNLGLHPYIELKSSGSYTQAQITQVVNEVAACGMKGKVTYISFNNTFLRYVKNADSSARLGFLTSTLASGNITTAKNLKTTTNEVFLDAKLATLKDSVVESCISNNIPLEVWTVNTEEEIINMHSYISGVTSDYLVAGRTLYNNALIYVPPVSTWVPTTGISLDKTTLVLTSFDPANLIAIVEPSNSSEEVVWKSSNTEIATVDNGVVIPITDGSCTITATSGDYSASCATTVAFTKFNITSNLTGCQLDNSINNVIIGTSWSGEVIPNEGYSLKNASIGITMGGVDITNTAYNNGIITIEKVTGDVVVNIVCVAVPVYNITRNLVGCTSNKDIISIGEGNPYNEVFTALDDYKLNGASVIITMGGVDISSMYSNGMLNIAEVTGDIVINITAVSIPVYNITRSLTNCVSNKDVTSIKEGESYTETLTANDGYTLRGANIVITMNGVNITSTSYFNGVLNIDSVTGDIGINVEAVEFKELVPVVDLDLVNVGTNGVIRNLGTGGSTYDTTIQTTSSSDKFSVTAGTGLTLNNHAYANIPYVLKSTDNFTIICKAKIVTKSSQSYQRFFRTDTDAPSWYYSKSNTKLQAKLTGKNSSESTISILGSLVSGITGTNNSGNSVIFNTNTTAICEVMFTCDGTDIKLYINGHASASQPASGLTETTYIGIGDNNPSTKYYASVLEISRFTIYDSVIVSSVIDGPPVNIRLTSNDLYQGAISAKNESVGAATLISPYRTNMTTRASTAADLSILVNGGTTVSIEAKDINGTAMQIGIQSFGDDALDALTNGESLYPYIIDSGWIASGGSYEIPITHKYAWIVVSYSNTSTNVNVSNIDYIQITETNI